MLYTTKFTLRLALRVSVVACLGLVVAKVVGGFNHDHILVYVNPNDVRNVSYHTIYLLDVERNLVNRLAPRNTNSLISSDCSADGRVAFDARIGGSDWDIYVMDIFGGSIVEVTDDPRDDFWGRWSPDGRYLAFISSSSIGGGEIYITDLSGNPARQITYWERVNERPVWLPDSSQLLFVSHGGFSPEIYAVTVDGYSRHQLTKNEVDESFPVSSPNGRSIAFASYTGVTSDIYIMDSGGANLRQLTHTDAFYNYPVWSPDGSHLVFLSNWPDPAYIADADGSNWHILAECIPYNRSPVWSPDGQYLTLLADGQGFIDLYSISPDHTNSRFIRRIGASPVLPVWCP